MQQQDPLGAPAQQEITGAKAVITTRLKPENFQQKRAATALLWWWQDYNANQSVQYTEHSSPDQFICAEQACTLRLGGIIPPLPQGQYSILYLYHVNGNPPCGRCVSQFEAIAGAGHALRVYYGGTNQKSETLPIYVSDFVQNNRYDYTYNNV